MSDSTWTSNRNTLNNSIPKLVNAVLSSFLSIEPELSRSKLRKQFCQSVTYFQRAENSWKLIEPELSLSNIPATRTTACYHYCRQFSVSNIPVTWTTKWKLLMQAVVMIKNMCKWEDLLLHMFVIITIV